ncbi:MAG: tetratricopeptide repeat protein [Gallionella sp.]
MNQQLSVDEAFEIAFSCHMKGDLEQAKSTYLMILEALPEEPRSLHFLGILLHKEERSDLAVQCVRRSIELFPESPGWRNDLGNMLAERGDTEAAEHEFENAIDLQPDNPMFWNNLGAMQERSGKTNEAQLSFRKAIAIDPYFGDALSNLANSLNREGKELEAAEFHCRAFVLEPTHDKPKSMLGIAYYKLGRLAEAAEVYREWMSEEPDNPIPRHLFAACSGEAVPTRASDAYVEKHFDKLAAKFDANLKNLAYSGPEMIAGALAKIDSPAENWTVLDAGCGTGLAARKLSPYAMKLTGVDISSAMLAEAKKGGLYHELVKCEVTSYLAAHPGCFDLIVAADTLIYFGALEELFASAFSALCPGGYFIFTVEQAAVDEAFRLNPHGRYCHGKNYLASTLLKVGFELLAMDSGVVRVEFGNPVDGLTISARRSS